MHLDFKDKFHFSIDDVFHSFMDLEFQKIKIHDHFILGRLFKNYETKGLYLLFIVLIKKNWY